MKYVLLPFLAIIYSSICLGASSSSDRSQSDDESHIITSLVVKQCCDNRALKLVENGNIVALTSFISHMNHNNKFFNNPDTRRNIKRFIHKVEEANRMLDCIKRYKDSMRIVNNKDIVCNDPDCSSCITIEKCINDRNNKKLLSILATIAQNDLGITIQEKLKIEQYIGKAPFSSAYDDIKNLRDAFTSNLRRNMKADAAYQLCKPCKERCSCYNIMDCIINWFCCPLIAPCWCGDFMSGSVSARYNTSLP